jgi:hypothetical protein
MTGRSPQGWSVRLAFLSAVASLGLHHGAFAAEDQFGFTYTTDLLPKRQFELEQTTTWKFTKNGGTFDLFQNITEAEYGVTDALQLAIDVDWEWTHAFHNGPYHQTTPPEQFSDNSPDPDAHFHSARVEAVAIEAEYRILSPYTNPVGLAVLLEPERGELFKEITAKVILQKNFLDDRLVTAFNFTYSPEYRWLLNDDGVTKSWQEETDVNYYFAASFRFASNWSVGAEFLNEHEYGESYKFTHEFNSGYYFGPTVHFGGKKFFLTATFARQLPWASNHADTIPGAVVNHLDFDNDFEKYRLRLKFAYYFGEGE